MEIELLPLKMMRGSDNHLINKYFLFFLTQSKIIEK